MHSIISFFTGAGFLDLGFEHAGFRVDLVNEFSREFIDGYRYSRAKLGSPVPRYGYHLGSIDEFLEGEPLARLKAVVSDARSEGRKVGFVGGPPCPDFSVAGKNAGGEGDNGRLTASYFSLIDLVKPDFFVFENVEGLWRTRIHRQFYDAQKARAEAAGYVLHDRLVNAICYGVGQDRSRIFLVGVLGGDPSLSFPWEMSMPYREDVLRLPWPGSDPFEKDGDRPFPEGRGLPEELTVGWWFRRNSVDTHPNASMAFNAHSGKFHEIAEGDVKRKSFKRIHRWRYSPTAAYGNNEVHLHPWEPRRLSVAEALAIQSLPPKYELPKSMPLSTCFKTIGNGVPYLAALGLAKSVASHLAAEEASRQSQPVLIAAE